MSNNNKYLHYFLVLSFMVGIFSILLSQHITNQLILILLCTIYLILIIKLGTCDFILKSFLQSNPNLIKEYKYSTVHQIHPQHTNTHHSMSNVKSNNTNHYQYLSNSFNFDNSVRSSNQHSVLTYPNKKKRIQGEPLQNAFNLSAKVSVNNSFSRINVESGVKFLPREYIDIQGQQKKFQKLQTAYKKTRDQYKLTYDQLQTKYTHIKKQLANHLKIHNQQQFENIQSIALNIQKYFNVKINTPNIPSQPSYLSYWNNFKQLISNESNYIIKLNSINLDQAIDIIIQYVNGYGIIQPWSYKKGITTQQVLPVIKPLVEQRKKLDTYLCQINEKQIQGQRRIQRINVAVNVQWSLTKKNDNRFEQIVDMDNVNTQKVFLIVFFSEYIQTMVKQSTLTIKLNKRFIQKKKEDYFYICLQQGYQTGNPHFNIKHSYNGVQYVINCSPGSNNIYSVIYFYFLTLTQKYEHRVKDKDNSQLRKFIQELLPIQSI